jgi:hypothetical protein
LYHSGRDTDKGWEEFRNDVGSDFSVLAESMGCKREYGYATRKAKENEPKRPDRFYCGNTTGMNFTNVITIQLALDLGQEIGPLVWEIMGDDGFKGSSELNCNVTRGRCSEKWQDVRAKFYPVCIWNRREI